MTTGDMAFGFAALGIIVYVGSAIWHSMYFKHGDDEDASEHETFRQFMVNFLWVLGIAAGLLVLFNFNKLYDWGFERETWTHTKYHIKGKP